MNFLPGFGAPAARYYAYESETQSETHTEAHTTRSTTRGVGVDLNLDGRGVFDLFNFSSALPSIISASHASPFINNNNNGGGGSSSRRQGNVLTVHNHQTTVTRTTRTRNEATAAAAADQQQDEEQTAEEYQHQQTSTSTSTRTAQNGAVLHHHHQREEEGQEEREEEQSPLQKMVVGLLVLAALPTTTGTSRAAAQQRSQESRDADAARTRKFHIGVYCDSRSRCAPEIHGGILTLRGGRVWIEQQLDGPTTHLPNDNNTSSSGSGSGTGGRSGGLKGYKAECFCAEYPDRERVPLEMGLVTRISDDPPTLNWLYVHSVTRELRYGNRSQSRPHWVGDWDWTEGDEEGVTLEGVERFVAVEVRSGGDKHAAGGPVRREWQVYFDVEDDGLKGYPPQREGRRVLQISLERRLKPEVEEVDDSDVEEREKEKERRGQKLKATSSTTAGKR